MKIEALKELAAKVEAGEWDHSPNGAARKIFPYKSASIDDLGLTAVEAFNGSLDAAKALHDALLPGWVYGLNFDARDEAYAFVGDGSDYETDEQYSENHARAWLLAILRTLIDQPTQEPD